MKSEASVTLLALGAALIQCYATRTKDACTPLSVHATMAECRSLASEYRKFDTQPPPRHRVDSGQLSVRDGRVIAGTRGGDGD